ncbi:hypothetical protein ABFX02_07G080900 [Erythranthe guttata]
MVAATFYSCIHNFCIHKIPFAMLMNAINTCAVGVVALGIDDDGCWAKQQHQWRLSKATTTIGKIRNDDWAKRKSKITQKINPSIDSYMVAVESIYMFICSSPIF